MSLADDIRDAITPKRCKFGDVFASLPEGDAAIIHNGFIAGLTATDAARILTKNGHRISATTVKDHVANTCCCQDAA